MLYLFLIWLFCLICSITYLYFYNTTVLVEIPPKTWKIVLILCPIIIPLIFAMLLYYIIISLVWCLSFGLIDLKS